MKKIIWIALLIVGYGLARVNAQTASFNFSRASQSVSGWVNVVGDPSVAVRSATDGTTGISVSSIATINWAPFTDGTCAYDGGGETGGTFFPAAVMMNHWYQYGPALADYNAGTPQLKISGLAVDSFYRIKMASSFNGSFNLNPTRYTLTGARIYGYVDVNNNYNTANGATFNNVQPDSTGHVYVYVNTVPTTQFGDISGIQIIKGTGTTPIPTVSLTNPGNNDVVSEDGNVNIAATASESGGTIAKVEFYANSTKIGEATTSPYSITWTNPDPGKYAVVANAIDAAGNANTSAINISVESLGTFWSTTGNITTSGDTFFVGTVDTNRLAFRTNNLERMTILKDGTIGIGTKNTLGYALAVNGTAIFTKVKVKTAGTWPDYVFRKGYRLLDLNQLESYIVLHKHLPGIVSAGDVDREGNIDMATQQTAMLKKIEELTLYLIGENRQLKEQNNRLEEQNKKLERQQQEIDELKRMMEKTMIQSKNEIH